MPTAHFEDASFKTAKLDLQGPQSRDVLKVLAPGIEKLAYYTFDQFQITGIPCLISRTGYTGELGYEIYCPWEKCKEIWKTILNNATVKPTGLGVRDVLRVEMCYSLYGHELEETISPLEAGLDKFIDGKKDFIGDIYGTEPSTGEYIKIVTYCWNSSTRLAPAPLIFRELRGKRLKFPNFRRFFAACQEFCSVGCLYRCPFFFPKLTTREVKNGNWVGRHGRKVNLGISS